MINSVTILEGMESSKLNAWEFLIQLALRTGIDIAKNFHRLF